MRWTDALVIHCSPLQGDYKRLWLEFHPEAQGLKDWQIANLMNQDDDLKQWWTTPLGKFNHDWLRLLAILTDRRVTKWEPIIGRLGRMVRSGIQVQTARLIKRITNNLSGGQGARLNKIVK